MLRRLGHYSKSKRKEERKKRTRREKGKEVRGERRVSHNDTPEKAPCLRRSSRG